MLKLISGLLMLWASAVQAAGTVPAVNTDMGCTVAGQSLQYSGSTLVCGAPQSPVTTVSSLPSCTSGLRGASYFVTDSLGPVALATVVGGGAVGLLVVCNGTSWIVQ